MSETLLRHATHKTRRLRAGRRRGFTLVELLVIIGILILLVGIISPAALNGLKRVNLAQSRAILHTISTGLETYYNEFEDYPPSAERTDEGGIHRYSNPTEHPMLGSELVALLLLGWPDDPDGDAEPADQAGEGEYFTEDDGNDGFGYRLRKRGTIHGPYGLEDLELDRTEDQQRPVFVDAWGNHILYYCFDNGYSYVHNSRSGFQTHERGPTMPQLEAYAKKDGNWRRNDYLLLSKGAKVNQSDWSDEYESDYVSNFRE